MLKKLQNLLFEDEDENEDEDQVEEEEEERPEPKRRPKQASRPAEERTAERQPSQPQPVTMQRIDVTQPIQQVNVPQPQPAYNSSSAYSQPAAPAVPHAQPRPLEEKPSLGLTVDEVKGTAPAAKPVEKPAAPARKKEPAKPKEPAYEFRPVISPMFGVDEKDMNAMQVTANSAKTGNTHDENVSQVISPIYGITREAEPANIQKTVQKSNEMESMSYTRESQKQEDDIPSFSLDDILNARDEDDAETADKSTADQSSDVDETVVMDTRGLTPFGKVNPPRQDAKDQK